MFSALTCHSPRKGGPIKPAISSFCHPQIIHIFRNVSTSPGTLFGILADIDNLGVYVARHGRAAAENLVEHFNQLLEIYLSEWRAEATGIPEMCIVSGGEEILILGVARERQCTESLFKNITREYNELLVHNKHYMDCSETSLTFGCALIEEPPTLDSIDLLVKRVHGTNSFDPYPLYLEVMRTIRQRLGVLLDIEKFKSLLNGESEPALLLRNYVYLKMLDYKRSTQNELPAFSEMIHKLKEDGEVTYPRSDDGLNSDLEEVLRSLHRRLMESQTHVK